MKNVVLFDVFDAMSQILYIKNYNVYLIVKFSYMIIIDCSFLLLFQGY